MNVASRRRFLKIVAAIGSSMAFLKIRVAKAAPYNIGGFWKSKATTSVVGDMNVAPVGKFFVWGGNANGQLGLGDVIARSSPVQIGSSTAWSVVQPTPGASGALTTNGALWMWGDNSSGQLGLGDKISRSSPVQVGSLNTWVTSIAQQSSAGIDSSGQLWTWGRNDSGQLGLGDTVYRSSPVQVGSLGDWKQIYAPSALKMIALKTNGTLWAWGWNASGQLGLGDKVNYSSPVQIGSEGWWHSVTRYSAFNVAALQTNGSLWTWGLNSSGQLGVGDVVNRSSPVRVGALTSWAYVSVGDALVLALQTDGSLWAWGDNVSGGLGLGDKVARSSPVRVGALSAWTRVGAGAYAAGGVQTDGSLWMWGLNSSGNLGLGDAVYRSSPVRVGALTTWKNVVVGGADPNSSGGVSD